MDAFESQLGRIPHSLIRTSTGTLNTKNHQIGAVNHRTVSDLMGRLEMFSGRSRANFYFVIVLEKFILVVSVLRRDIGQYKYKCAVIITHRSSASADRCRCQPIKLSITANEKFNIPLCKQKFPHHLFQTLLDDQGHIYLPVSKKADRKHIHSTRHFVIPSFTCVYR